jgi:hypothetical protein
MDDLISHGYCCGHTITMQLASFEQQKEPSKQHRSKTYYFNKSLHPTLSECTYLEKTNPIIIRKCTYYFIYTNISQKEKRQFIIE